MSKCQQATILDFFDMALECSISSTVKNMTLLLIFKEEDASHSNVLSRLRVGCHYIGREAPISCTDKRISRKHALIVVHRNGAVIKSAHVNPTFFKSSMGGTIQILRENDTLALNNGDRFALVEDATWFKVKIIYENTAYEATNEISFNAISNKRTHEEDNTELQKRIKVELPEFIEEAVNTSNLNIDTSNAVNGGQNVENINIVRPTLDDSNVNIYRPNLNETLPDNPDHSTDKPDLDDQVPINTDRPDLDDTLPINTEELLNETLPANPNIVCITAEDINQTENFTDIDGIETENIDFDSGTTASSSPTHNQEIKVKTEPGIKEEPLENDPNQPAESDPNEPTHNQEAKVKMEPGIKEEPPENGLNEPTENNQNVPSSSTNSNPTGNPNLRRDRCWYGQQCYRKNPIHKQNFSHPVDVDYDSDPNDRRPVCPFGVHCYQKNIPHRRQYRHFGRPAPRPSNVNVHLHVNNCPCCGPNNRHRKPNYESDYESDPDY